jgi:(E)-4-hydroxy-3-methylbut-2-enyl-diphosphate synthase
MQYCESIFKTVRWKTREVLVGAVGVGGNNPIRIQSMTTSNTRDVDATVDQIMRLADAGCEIARVTVQGMKEAEACEGIKAGLLKRGYTIPLVADIHFYPPAALAVADFVDKVRINPGNFVDKRASFKTITYSDASYLEELEKIEEKFTPLVEKCKRLGRAMRIGTNHGSLSDRIMNRYGDTPAGMVESALEFTRVARKLDFHDIIFSMKASNPIVMIHAYRLLVAEMMELGWDYPLHLGVTEAGDGEDGRVKSAAGIGSLLLDGLGDTIRVSLTEDPWYEIDPCQRIVKLAAEADGEGIMPFEEQLRDFRQIDKQPIRIAPGLPLHRDGSVYLRVKPDQLTDSVLGLRDGERESDTVDGVVLTSPLRNQQRLAELTEQKIGLFSGETALGALPIFSLSTAQTWLQTRERASRFALKLSHRESFAVRLTGFETEEEWEQLAHISPSLLFLAPADHRLHACRRFCDWMKSRKLNIPILFNFSYDCGEEDLTIRAAAEIGALLCDGLGDGICLEGPYDPRRLRLLSFNILQAARRRASRTEFIACPSCGRTLFDLQTVTAEIRQQTSHLPGVKIAIMGCIVNGPGEMADADFGYVGSTTGKIDLYVGKEKVEKNIDASEACERLIQLIKIHNRWIEPKEVVFC